MKDDTTVSTTELARLFDTTPKTIADIVLGLMLRERSPGGSA